MSAKTHESIERWFRIDLAEPVALTQGNNKVGSQHTLDYIPGRMLLGVVAGKLYQRLGADAWTVFHSGKVRFLDALPWHPASPRGARPTALSFHQEKGGDEDNKMWLNFAAPQSAKQPGKQYVQQRGKYFVLQPSQDSTYQIEPLRILRASYLKTAIDPRTGRAQDASLFGFEAMLPGQSFVMCLSCDADVSVEVLEMICETLTGVHYLGRSRGAEFGCAKVQALKEVPTEPENALAGRRRVAVFLRSDLVLVDAKTGAQRLKPEAADFGLPPSWSFDADASALRFYAYERFNGYRRSFDLRRESISRGSVLVFKGDSELSAEQIAVLRARERRSAGVDRQEGLGSFEAAPKWLDQVVFSRWKDESPNTFKPGRGAEFVAQLDMESRRLFEFVAGRNARNLTVNERDILNKSLRELEQFYAQYARPFSGKDIDDLPSASQWGNVLTWAENSRGGVDLNEFLDFLRGTHGQFEKGWEVEFDGIALADWLAKRMETVTRRRHFLTELARHTRATYNRTQQVNA